MDLDDAVAQAGDGGTIMLEPGTYTLLRTVSLGRDVRIIGEGLEVCTIAIKGKGPLFVKESQGSAELRGLTICQKPMSQDSCVELRAGALQVQACDIIGGGIPEGAPYFMGTPIDGKLAVAVKMGEVGDEHAYVRALRTAGCGVLAHAQATNLQIRACRLSKHTEVGIALLDQVQFALEDVSANRNALSGLVVAGNARGSVTRSRFSENYMLGLNASEKAELSLENNEFIENYSSGIHITTDQVRLIRGNTCRYNGGDGLEIQAGRDAVIEKNKFLENSRGGLRVFSLTGTVRGNQCEGNEWDGIMLSEGSTPAVQSNRCRDNRLSGIRFTDGAGGKVEDNLCSGNWVGLWMGAGTQPQVGRNVLNGNLRAPTLREGWLSNALGFLAARPRAPRGRMRMSSKPVWEAFNVPPADSF
jgi:parallel beta-helix repeat protein